MRSVTLHATGVSRIRERVERFLAEEHPERLNDLRDSMRRHPQLRSDVRSGRRLTKMQAGIDGSVGNLIPLLHLRRALRGAPAPLETLRNRCWATGFQSGIEVDARSDFACVLDRWARHRSETDGLDAGRTEPEHLAEAVVRRLRASRFWKLALGFVPIVGPVAAYRIDAALALRFHDRATEYFRELRAAGVRPLPDDFAIPRPPRPPRERKKDGSPDSMRRTVERVLAGHRSDDHERDVRGMARIGESARTARWIAGSSGLFTNLIPTRHLQARYRDLDTHMLLTTLQGIWRQAATKAGLDGDPGDDFERVLLLWAGGDPHVEAPSPTTARSGSRDTASASSMSCATTSTAHAQMSSCGAIQL